MRKWLQRARLEAAANCSEMKLTEPSSYSQPYSQLLPPEATLVPVCRPTDPSEYPGRRAVLGRP
jgi:hypothetical protein